MQLTRERAAKRDCTPALFCEGQVSCQLNLCCSLQELDLLLLLLLYFTLVQHRGIFGPAAGDGVVRLRMKR